MFVKRFDYQAQFERTLGLSVRGGADIGECFSLLPQIKSCTPVSWFSAWNALASRLQQQAVQWAKKYPISAGEVLLRVSNYYRTAYFFLETDPSDERIQQALSASITAFQEALTLLQVRYQAIAVSFEQIQLPGYVYWADGDNPKPLLIDTGGGDGTLEEAYFGSPLSALRRGFHCLTIEGPGQGRVLRQQRVPFRPDSEKVISAVLDYIQDDPKVDKQKIALRGDSFGGYLAARAAAYEKRLSACVVNPGIIEPARPLAERYKRMSFISKLLYRLSPRRRFLLQSRLMRFGAASVEEVLAMSKQFSVESLIPNISCSMLVLDNESEHLTPGEARRLYSRLTCRKAYHKFSALEGASGHCQPLARQLTEEVIFNWLETELIKPYGDEL